MNVWLHPRVHQRNCGTGRSPIGTAGSLPQSPMARHQHHGNEADLQRSNQESRHNDITLPDSTTAIPGLMTGLMKRQRP